MSPAAVHPVEAAAIGAWLLRDEPRRLRHSRGVAARARQLAVVLPPARRDLLVAAASLHDIGHAAGLVRTGFHPLDGALYLESLGLTDLAALVAHHSGARYVAAELGLGAALGRFPFREDPLTDALTAADQTVDQEGRPVGVEQRMRDMLHRHGDGSPQARVHAKRSAYLVAAVARTEALVVTSGAGARPA